MKVEEHVPFSTLTTFKVGGSVRYVLSITPEESQVAVAFAQEKGLPLIPLGGGSNMLGVDGVLDAVMVHVTDDHVLVHGEVLEAGAGAVWDGVVACAAEARLWGIENLSAIPGTMGGAVVQNIGAYGAVLSDTLVSVRAYDTHEGLVKEFSKDVCAFGYRTSIFKIEMDRYIILSATLKLSVAPKPNLGYKDLQSLDVSSSVSDIRNAVMQVRGRKFPDLREYGTAGSFFLNPVVPHHEAERMQAAYPEMPLFPLPEGGTKIPLGWFFEHVMKLRGYREGAVEAWRAQALVIAAHPGATATDVRNFVKAIIDRTKKEIGLNITPEVRVL